jgi:hypothetical protein
VPNITIYFDDLLQETQGFCEDHFVTETDQLYVVCNNFNMFMSTIEFGLDFNAPGALTYLGDVHLPGALALGTSPTGVTITYPLPQNAFDPFICMLIDVLWLCDDCGVAGGPWALSIVPHPGTGVVQGIEWQTFRVVNGVGMTSLVCPGIISTEETSWGAIKALYNN